MWTKVSKFPFGLLALVLLWSGGALRTYAGVPDKLSQGQHTADVRGIRVAYYVEGSGPLLVVQSPGWGVPSNYMRSGLAPLETRFTLIFYDTRGSGQTSKPVDDKLSTSIEVDDLEGLRRYLGIDNISLLGHSHGGSIALGYAIRYPTHVKRLILVDSGINDMSRAWWDKLMNKELKKRADDPRYKAAVAIIKSHAADNPASDEEFAKELETRTIVYFYDPEKNAAKLRGGPPPSAWASSKDIELDASIRERHAMGAVQAKTLVVAGREDWICGPVVAERIHKGIAGSELLILEKTGHFPWLEDAAPQFFDAVETFLKE